MAVYDYRALSTRGKPVSGIIDASGIESARTKLKAKGLYIQEISEIGKSRRGKRVRLSLSGKRAVTGRITRQLAFLTGAQVPVVSAIDSVTEQLEDESIRRVMVDIAEKIREGQSVSRAFSAHSSYFNTLYIQTLHAGEISGNLDTAFERLADSYEKAHALMASLQSALTYPVLMLFFAVGVIIFLVSFIVPTFSALFEEFGQVLPLPTRVLIAFSDFFTAAWWIILIVLGGAALLTRRFYRSDRGKDRLDRLLFRIPILRGLLVDTFRIRFARTMGMLLGSGIGIIESMESTAGVFTNVVFVEAVGSAAERVRKGERLSSALSREIDPRGKPLFDPSLVGMIHAGEAGDRVPGVLDRMASGIEVDLTQRIGVLTSLAEPVLILVLGSIVAFVVLSIMLPIFSFNQLVL
jgi:general secretion pathway protein F